ncbi:MAG: DMT family transporter [Rikenellaceae bacterium]
MLKSTSIKYHISLIVANIMFGANYSFYKSLIGDDLSSDSLYLLRTFFTALFFIPAMFIAKKAKVDWHDIKKIVIVSVLLIFGRQYLMIDAMNYASPITGSIIATTGPIIIMIISAIMIHEKITVSRTFGVLLGAAGAITMIMSNYHTAASNTPHSWRLYGDLMLLASIIFSSINTVYVKNLFSKYSPYTIMGWASIIGVAVVVPIFAHDFLKTDFTKWTPYVYGSLGYMLLLGTVLATAMLYYGLRGVSATSSSIYVYIQPIVATILATFRGQDKLTLTTMIAAALVFIGVFFVIISNKKTGNEIMKNHFNS